jgi:mannose-6-phosphate isomerase-like protein (cupin superfamily)
MSKSARGSNKPAEGRDKMIRRVVTGKDESGKAVSVMDGISSNSFTNKDMGVTSTLMWATDSAPADISGNDDTAKRPRGVQPAPGGTIFSIVDFAPQKSLESSPEARRQLMRQMGLGPEGEFRPNHNVPGMHRTRTLDYVLVLSGEIDLVMDDSEVHLKAGDVVVQRGTNHAWVNRGDQPCRIAAVAIGAGP